MSFFTCFWLFPQNEHLSRSPPSPMRATRCFPFAWETPGSALLVPHIRRYLAGTPSRGPLDVVHIAVRDDTATPRGRKDQTLFIFRVEMIWSISP